MSEYYRKQKTVRGHTRYDPRSDKSVNVHSYNRNQRYRNYETVPMSKARELFNQRSERAKASDLSKTSKKVLDEPNEDWAKNIGKIDVKGIDTKKKIKIKYAKDHLNFYLKGFSAGKDWIKDISKENLLDLKQLSEYDNYSNKENFKWDKNDQKQAKRLYNEYLSAVNYEWVSKIAEGDLKKHIGATEQAIYLLNGEIKQNNKFLKEGYDLTKEVLGKEIADREKKNSLDIIKKAKEKKKEKKTDLEIFKKELEQRAKKGKKNINKDLNELIKKFENKTEWKKTTSKIESFGDIVIMSKDNVALVIDSDSIKTSEWYKNITSRIGYFNIKPSDKEIKHITHKYIDYVQLPTSDLLYQNDYYKDAIQNFKNPKIHIASNCPVIIEGKDKSMVIAPFIPESF